VTVRALRREILLCSSPQALRSVNLDSCASIVFCLLIHQNFSWNTRITFDSESVTSAALPIFRWRDSEMLFEMALKVASRAITHQRPYLFDA
jgi:hypothetical protein